jgi:hypothetical protein
LTEYHENWAILLEGAAKEVKQVVQEAQKRITGPHLKDSDYKPFILSILFTEKKPLGRQEIVGKLERQLHGRFTDYDRELSKNTGMPRWEKTARWAITNMKGENLIQSIERNQWVITEKGRSVFIRRLGREAAGVSE